MDDLIAFLRARLDEDAQDALLALRGYPGGKPEVMQSWKRSARWRAGDGRITVEYVEKPPVMIQPEPERPVLVRVSRRDDECTAAHIARQEPARVLVDVAAKRQILDVSERTVEAHKLCTRCVTCVTVRLLALPYADHPDHREEWQP